MKLNLIVLIIAIAKIIPTIGKVPDLGDQGVINIMVNTTVKYNQIHFYKEYQLVRNSRLQIDLNIKHNVPNTSFGYVVLQVHSFAYNVTLSLNETLKLNNHQNGTHLGFLLQNSGKYFIYNFFNHIDCDLAIILIAYDQYTPLPGGCNLENDLTQSPNLYLSHDRSDIFNVDTPLASYDLEMDPKQKLCDKIDQKEIIYDFVYHYLPKGNFEKKMFFETIQMFANPRNANETGSKALKKAPFGPSKRRSYIVVSGTGIVMNTIVSNAHGKNAAYVPILTYMCQPMIWDQNGCTIIPDKISIKILAYLLIIVGGLKLLVFFVEPVSLFFNALPIGAYIAFRISERWDIIPEIRGTIIIIISIIFAGIILILTCGNFIVGYIYGVITTIVLSWILSLNIFYIFEASNVPINDGLYEFLFWFSVFILLCMIFPCFSTAWCVINLAISAYSIIIGFQILAKSNMLLIVLNHFNRISNNKFQYANGYPTPDHIDISIFSSFIGLFLIGFIFKKNKIIVCGNRSRLNGYERILDENEPIITRWTHGSDDVFESPNTNHNFFQGMARSPVWG